MKISPDDFAETVSVARDYLQGSRGDPEVLARDFAEALVQLDAVAKVKIEQLRSLVGEHARRIADKAADFAVECAQLKLRLAVACVVGAACEKHGGALHGQEAEELRAGVEQILRNTSAVRDDEAAFVLAELRKSLIFLLDRVDARDSFAFLEAMDSKEDTSPCA